jgi:hypothetical protein
LFLMEQKWEGKKWNLLISGHPNDCVFNSFINCEVITT